MVLYVVLLGNPQRLPARVSQRVREGGHNVPAARILERYPRTKTNLKKAARTADLAFVYNAAEVAQVAHVLVAICKKNKTTALVDVIPDWARAMLSGV